MESTEGKLALLKKEVETIAESLVPYIKLEEEKDTDKLRLMFRQCFVNTAHTTVEYLSSNEVFVITGDITAMWLRDSSCQVVHYLKFINQYPELKHFIQCLIKKQFEYIKIDPYGNAFMRDTNCKSKYTDRTKMSELGWERKYELDSLCYPIWLLYQYYSETKDTSIFTQPMKETLHEIISLWKMEQYHDTKSAYYFERFSGRPKDTLPYEGKGAPTSYTGMTWSGFRPSDDGCQYGYHVPSNMFATVVLQYIEEISATIYEDKNLEEEARQLRLVIQEGIEQHGVYQHEVYGDIYGYETDGNQNFNLMDDANVPSLLSIPWLGYKEASDERYQNTRRYILSEDNPYYFSGEVAKGIGSPHTPVNYIWPIGLIMQGLTTEDLVERKLMLDYLMKSDAGTNYMHEGFNFDEPERYTRSWFAWANSLFSLYVMDMFPSDEKNK